MIYRVSYTSAVDHKWESDQTSFTSYVAILLMTLSVWLHSCPIHEKPSVGAVFYGVETVEDVKLNVTVLSVVRRKYEHTSDLWFIHLQMCSHCNWNGTLAVQPATSSTVTSTFHCSWIFVLIWQKWMSLLSHTSSTPCLYIMAWRQRVAITTALCWRLLVTGTRWMMPRFVV